MLKVLLVEDDQNLSNLYKTELEMLGASVLMAGDGQTGLDLAEKEKPDLIILDIILPEKIGISVLKELKSKDETKDIPVVVMSNFDQGDNPQKAKDLGAISFLSKQEYTPQQIAKEAVAVLK